MNTKELILRQARRKGVVRTSDIGKFVPLSRQTIVQHFRELVAAGKLVKQGSTRNASYVPRSRKTAFLAASMPAFARNVKAKGLSEDQVFEEAAMKMGLARRLSAGAYKIARYTFTEMLNNAIEHSKSPRITTELSCAQGQFLFRVCDRGVGAFESVRRKFGLKNHFEAVEHLLKGKQSADPEHHSGQGIFFTSRIADRFVLESARLKLIVDNKARDTFLEDIRTTRGTRVMLFLKAHSRKDLKALFDEYSNEDFEFDKTVITVHLSPKQGGHVSRSEARRLLFGLDRFKRIVLDFKKIPGIGQGFADEIFRVFQAAHPKIRIESIHESGAVAFMIKRAQRQPYN